MQEYRHSLRGQILIGVARLFELLGIRRPVRLNRYLLPQAIMTGACMWITLKRRHCWNNISKSLVRNSVARRKRRNTMKRENSIQARDVNRPAGFFEAAVLQRQTLRHRFASRDTACGTFATDSIL
jgi:hypothetical protein